MTGFDFDSHGGAVRAVRRLLQGCEIAAPQLACCMRVRVLQTRERLQDTEVSGNHTAFEQFVGAGCRYAVDERHMHLRIVPQGLHRPLLHVRLLPGRWVAFLLRQLLARRGLILLDHLLGDQLHEWVLLRASEANRKQHGDQCKLA